MDLQCKICKHNFTSLFLLQRHQNKTIPCGVELKCDRCKKYLKIFQH